MIVPRTKELESQSALKNSAINSEEFKNLFLKLQNAEKLDRNERLYLLKKTQEFIVRGHDLNPQQRLNYCNAQRQLIKVCLRSLLK
ncbi:MAG: hypothetical protein ACTSU4_09565 [Promethearchaeota archaeon]